MSLETRFRSLADEPVLGHDELDAALHGATSLGHRKVVRRRAGMAALAMVLTVGVGTGIVAATGNDPATTNVVSTPDRTEPPDDSDVPAPTTTTTPPPTTTPTTTVVDAAPAGVLPRSGQPIANGKYFGFIRSVDVEAGTFSFDVAQWYEGEAADNAAREDGTDDTPDYYVRNNSKEARTLTVDESFKGTVERQPGEKQGVSLSGLDTRVRETRGEMSAWVTLRNGKVILAEEQWVP